MIDHSRLTELKSEIGEEDFVEVATMFLDEMATTLRALRAEQAVPTARDFHSLRGSALNMGFTDLAAACAEAELNVSTGQTADVVHLEWLFHESLIASGPNLPSVAA